MTDNLLKHLDKIKGGDEIASIPRMVRLIRAQQRVIEARRSLAATEELEDGFSQRLLLTAGIAELEEAESALVELIEKEWS